MLNKVIKMVIDINTMIQTYKWIPDRNKLPFNWKCQRCGTITPITEIDINKTYQCTGDNCPIKLKFVIMQI